MFLITETNQVSIPSDGRVWVGPKVFMLKTRERILGSHALPTKKGKPWDPSKFVTVV